MKDNNLDISYQNNDIILKSMAQEFKDKSLKFYGINVPKIVTVIPADLPVIEVKEDRLDFIFLLEDDSLLHMEFQTTNKKADIKRFLQYDARLYGKYERKIRTVVIYSGKIEEAISRLDVGSIIYKVDQVFLAKYDGDKIYKELNEKIDRKLQLTDIDKLNLIFLPLMGSKKSSDEMAIDAVELAKKIEDEDEKTYIIGALIGISDKFLTEEYKNKLKGAIKMTKIAEMLIQEGKAEGKAEGKVEGKAELIIKLLNKKFNKIPELYAKRMYELNIDKLEKIGENIFDIKKIEDLDKYFNDN
ncbi:DUF4351 domain-containing protein [Thermoanaerobacterium thermosaccharolyticum]|uniref:DUF4351 domain-containing protein n=1 Tax=Thermoanaerobacterium thermosaccharolyticum TaxID=1517 RepID=UPI0027A031F6|nr:DUF4351 domain-containing protein [Thermoanaerobacterium thermosaccharolyticum]